MHCLFGNQPITSGIIKSYFTDPCDIESQFSSNHKNLFGTGQRTITFYQNTGYDKHQLIKMSVDEFMKRELSPPQAAPPAPQRSHECNFQSCVVKVDALFRDGSPAAPSLQLDGHGFDVDHGTSHTSADGWMTTNPDWGNFNAVQL